MTKPGVHKDVFEAAVAQRKKTQARDKDGDIKKLKLQMQALVDGRKEPKESDRKPRPKADAKDADRKPRPKAGGGTPSDRAAGTPNDRAAGDPVWEPLGAFKAGANNEQLRAIMSSGPYFLGRDMVLAMVHPTLGTACPNLCYGDMFHRGCKFVGCQRQHIGSEFLAEQVKSAHPLLQCHAALRGGWSSLDKLSVREASALWDNNQTKLAAVWRDKAAGRLDLRDCDPGYRQAAEGVPHVGESDLLRELLGHVPALLAVAPVPPSIRPEGRLPEPRSAIAAMRDTLVGILPQFPLVMRENELFRALVVQHGGERALRLHALLGAGEKLDWEGVVRDTLVHFLHTERTPIHEQAQRCLPELVLCRGTAGAGGTFTIPPAAGSSRRTPRTISTEVLHIGPSIDRADRGLVPVARMRFHNRQWLVPEFGEDVNFGGRIVRKQCVIKALAGAWLAQAGADVSRRQVEAVSSAIYATVGREGDQRWAVMSADWSSGTSGFFQ